MEEMQNSTNILKNEEYNLEYTYTEEKSETEINLKDPYNHKEEKYHLITEEKEMLLCKEDIFNKVKNEIGENDEIKIIELIKRENENNYYYINKEDLKQRYLKDFFDLEKINKELQINNKDAKEMKKLYDETIKKQPRKNNNGHMEKYSFFSWTGFFCCKKNDFISLGLGISSYFKMIKLFIVFFFIISCINFYAIFHYSKYKSILSNDSLTLKTTLGNTMINNYNLFINSSTVDLNCSAKLIGKIIFGLRFKDLDENNFQKLNNIIIENNKDPSPNLTVFKNFKSFNYSTIAKKELYNYNENISHCFLKNKCEFTSNNNNSNNINDLLFYECIDETLLPKNTSPNSLKYITLITTISTSLLFIILYYFFKFAIIYENSEYHKGKVIINNYTLKLSGLKFNSYDYNQEINNLICFLNVFILSQIKKNRNSFKQQEDNSNNTAEFDFKNIDNLNIFDISISTVDKKKMKVFESIKNYKAQIKDIQINNDSIIKKIKNKLKQGYKDIHIFYNNIVENKKKKNDIDNQQEDLRGFDLPLIAEEEPVKPPKFKVNKNSTLLLSKTKQDKIETKKEKIKSKISKIPDDIIQLHFGNERTNFVDIYMTFRNPSISEYIYRIYNKNKIKRFFIYLFCKGHKIKKYYYKNQWLNFDLCNTGPNDINWENFYYSTKRRRFQKIITFLISIVIIIITIGFIIVLKWKFFNSPKFVTLSISLLIAIVNVVSLSIVEKFTLYEENITLTNNISSNTLKSFIFNFIVSAIVVHISSELSLIFTYEHFSDYFKVIDTIISPILYSIITAHISPILFYLYNLFQKYIDSKTSNGKTTKKNDKSEYEKIYVGPEFPIGQRYSTILVSLTICFFYGSFCPIIYIFFTFFLITTFIVDKFLIINYYKKPLYYNIYLSKIALYFYIFGIIVHFYGTIFHLSNPYLFNYYQNNSYNERYFSEKFYLIVNPFAILFYNIRNNKNKLPILVFNFSGLSQMYSLILIFLFIFPFIIINIITFFFNKHKKSKSLQNAPIYDIGLIYSVNELKKYYEIKKLELFKFLIGGGEYNIKFIQNYYFLAYNYKNAIDYLKEYINYRQSQIDEKNPQIKKKESNESQSSTDTVILQYKEAINEHIISDDYLSYNLTFIPKYEIYSYFDLLYYA